MRNVVLTIGIQSISLAFWACALTITQPRIPDGAALFSLICLCGICLIVRCREQQYYMLGMTICYHLYTTADKECKPNVATT